MEAARSRLAGARAELAAPGGSPARKPRERPHSTQGGRGRSLAAFPPATASKRSVCAADPQKREPNYSGVQSGSLSHSERHH